METELLQYLPTWFRDIRDFSELMGAQTDAFQEFAALMDAVHSNFFVSTADEETVRSWERLLRIRPEPSHETLEFRRVRVINRLSYKPPFTLRFLYDRLDLLIGPGRWAVTVDYAAYTLYVEAAAASQSWAGEVWATMNTVKPCHIVYVSRPLVPSALSLCESVHLAATVYNYRLGSWRLGQLAFNQNEDRGVLITENQKTLQGALLDAVASFAAADVSAARLNGGVLITNFAIKTASGNTATIAYAVTPEHTTLITQVELLDEHGAVLERAPVYVPVTDTLHITHRIPVKEGVS